MDERHEPGAGYAPVIDRTVIATGDGSPGDAAAPNWGEDLTERLRELFVNTDPDLRIWLERSLWLSRWV